MSQDDKRNNPYVSLTFCNERFERLMDKFDVVKTKIEVVDAKVDKIGTLEQTKSRDWRILVFSILGSIISGVCVAGVLTWFSTVI